MATIAEKKTKILALLDSQDRAVIRAIEVVYDRQTASEKACQTTTDANGRGFSGADAEFGSSLGSKIKKGWKLTPKQIAAGRKMMRHYWKQLIEVADKKTPGWADSPATKMVMATAMAAEIVKSAPVIDDIAEGNAFGKFEAEQEAKVYAREAQKEMFSLREMGF